MRKWTRDPMRRRRGKPPSDSESTGKVGQAKPAGVTPLQPLYPDIGDEQHQEFLRRQQAERGSERRETPPPPEPAPRESHEPSADRQQQEPRNDRPPREQRSRRRRRGRRPPRQDQPRPPQQQQARVEVETQPESPSAPPSGVPEGRPPHKQAPKAPRGVVVLAIGLPGSGKTTWFKRRGVTPLSSDTLRTILFDNITEQRYQDLVFSTLRSLLRARLIAKMPWNYVDATNLAPRERKQWIHMARDFGYEVHAVFFDVPLEVCMERNQRRERVVPEDVMRRLAAKLKPPTFDEGFAKVTYVRVKQRPGESGEAGDESGETG